MKSRMLAGLALILALAVPVAWAQWEGGPGEGSGPPGEKWFQGRHDHGLKLGMVLRMLDEPAFRQRIGITDAQADKLRAQGFGAAKAGVRAHADIAIRHIELAELMQAEKPDRDAIDKKLRELADLQYAAMKARVDNELAIRELLTPEQREKIKAFSRERMREHRGMRGGPPPMGPPPGRGPHGPGAGGPPGVPPAPPKNQ